MLPILKLYKRFWNKIVSGEKKYEFRKLEKGLDEGDYWYVNAESETFIGPFEDEPITIPKGWFGSVHLKPIAINVTLFIKKENEEEQRGTMNYSNYFSVNKETYEFVKENYIDKNINFICYEISDVKEMNNEF